MLRSSWSLISIWGFLWGSWLVASWLESPSGDMSSGILDFASDLHDDGLTGAQEPSQTKGNDISTILDFEVRCSTHCVDAPPTSSFKCMVTLQKYIFPSRSSVSHL